MPTLCIQCSMKALIAGDTPPVFDETPEAHQQRMHPDLAATRRERVELERQLRDRMKPS